MTDAFETIILSSASDAATAVEDCPAGVFQKLESYYQSCKQKWMLVNFGDDAAEISAFSFSEQTGAATIDSEDATVDIEVEYGTDPAALVATFTLSTDARHAKVGGVAQVSETTSNDFSSPVTYQVTAENGKTKDWTVTVTVAEEA